MITVIRLHLMSYVELFEFIKDTYKAWGAVNQTYSASESGNYYVEVTVNGCNLTEFENKEPWTNLKNVIKISSIREINAVITKEERFYISSLNQTSRIF